jgi:hypothetical protein
MPAGLLKEMRDNMRRLILPSSPFLAFLALVAPLVGCASSQGDDVGDGSQDLTWFSNVRQGALEDGFYDGVTADGTSATVWLKSNLVRQWMYVALHDKSRGTVRYDGPVNLSTGRATLDGRSDVHVDAGMQDKNQLAIKVGEVGRRPQAWMLHRRPTDAATLTGHFENDIGELLNVRGINEVSIRFDITRSDEGGNDIGFEGMGTDTATWYHADTASFDANGCKLAFQFNVSTELTAEEKAWKQGMPFVPWHGTTSIVGISGTCTKNVPFTGNFSRREQASDPRAKAQPPEPAPPQGGTDS